MYAVNVAVAGSDIDRQTIQRAIGNMLYCTLIQLVKVDKISRW